MRAPSEPPARVGVHRPAGVRCAPSGPALAPISCDLPHIRGLISHIRDSGQIAVKGACDRRARLDGSPRRGGIARHPEVRRAPRRGSRDGRCAHHPRSPTGGARTGPHRDAHHRTDGVRRVRRDAHPRPGSWTTSRGVDRTGCSPPNLMPGRWIPLDARHRPGGARHRAEYTAFDVQGTVRHPARTGQRPGRRNLRPGRCPGLTLRPGPRPPRGRCRRRCGRR